MRISGPSLAAEAARSSPASPSPSPPVRHPGPAQPAPAQAEAHFAHALRGLGGAVDRGEALIERAAHGNLGGLDAGQLIAIQAGIYRYSEAVDLVAKLVDRTSTAVRTLLSPH